jgi:hypothetical protein
MSAIFGMKIVPPGWFAAMWCPKGRPVKITVTAATLPEVLEAMEAMKDNPDYKEIKVFRHGANGLLRRWRLPGDGYSIQELAGK